LKCNVWNEIVFCFRIQEMWCCSTLESKLSNIFTALESEVWNFSLLWMQDIQVFWIFYRKFLQFENLTQKLVTVLKFMWIEKFFIASESKNRIFSLFSHLNHAIFVSSVYNIRNKSWMQKISWPWVIGIVKCRSQLFIT